VANFFLRSGILKIILASFSENLNKFKKNPFSAANVFQPQSAKTAIAALVLA
jgi:hypothetical protein